METVETVETVDTVETVETVNSKNQAGLTTLVIHRSFAPTIIMRYATRKEAYVASQQFFQTVKNKSSTAGLSEKFALESQLPEVGVGSTAEFIFILLAGHGEPAPRYGIESSYVVKRLPTKSKPIDYLYCLQV